MSVMSVMNKHNRALMAQLSLEILLIKKEKDRFRNIPLEEKNCDLCRMNGVADEERFLCKYTLYDDLTQSVYIKPRDVCTYLNSYSSEQKLIALMKYICRDVSV